MSAPPSDMTNEKALASIPDSDVLIPLTETGREDAASLLTVTDRDSSSPGTMFETTKIGFPSRTPQSTLKSPTACAVGLLKNIERPSLYITSPARMAISIVSRKILFFMAYCLLLWVLLTHPYQYQYS